MHAKSSSSIPPLPDPVANDGRSSADSSTAAMSGFLASAHPRQPPLFLSSAAQADQRRLRAGSRSPAELAPALSSAFARHFVSNRFPANLVVKPHPTSKVTPISAWHRRTSSSRSRRPHMLRMKRSPHEAIVLYAPEGEITIHFDGPWVCIDAPRAIGISRKPREWVPRSGVAEHPKAPETDS